MVRKGLGKGRGKGYRNIQGRDPKIHSDSSKGRKQPQKVPYIKEPFGLPFELSQKDKFKRPNSPKHLPKGKMMEEIKVFMADLSKKIDNDDYMVTWDEDRKLISLSTDSTMYETLFDPSSSDMPYLLEEAFNENNVPKGKRFKVDVYTHQEEFRKFLEERGWNYELYGGGIIHIYKD